VGLAAWLIKLWLIKLAMLAPLLHSGTALTLMLLRHPWVAACLRASLDASALVGGFAALGAGWRRVAGVSCP